MIRGERHGVEMQNTSRYGEIEKRFPALIPAIIHAMAIQSIHRIPPNETGKRNGGKASVKNSGRNSLPV